MLFLLAHNKFFINVSAIVNHIHWNLFKCSYHFKPPHKNKFKNSHNLAALWRTIKLTRTHLQKKYHLLAYFEIFFYQYANTWLRMSLWVQFGSRCSRYFHVTPSFMNLLNLSNWHSIYRWRFCTPSGPGN